MKTRKAFDIHSGKDLHNVELVDENGNHVDVYPTPDGSAVFIIDGTAYSMEDAEDMLFEEVDDNSIDVYKTDVSDYAKEFQKNEDIESAHCGADNVLCDLLKTLGFEDVVQEYYKVEKWYS